MKAKQLTRTTGAGDEPSGWVISCPACGHWHLFDSRWEFNGDPSSPTFSPSMLVRSVDKDLNPSVCHSFVRAGSIEFLGDCTHAMAGQTVELPDAEA